MLITGLRRPFVKGRLFLRCQKGLAAVEFAFLLPVMITLFLGITETSDALSARADVADMASTAADLVAQETAATPVDMANVFNAAAAILYPYPTNVATITLYSIIDNGSSQGRVAWSCAKTGDSPATTGPSSPPSGSTGGDIIADSNLVNGVATHGGGGSVILVTISYPYSSRTTHMFVGTVTMSNTFYSKPRRVAQVTPPASCS
ncbi:MAG TPA: TadE/TadG family type IV pilus assembly protein [Rhizomicrobium sp.]|jgi:Flp pilus assembly protein TadG|nr:TadE/TadG family type IV pilus assembly protein [Rhizomicrobium sp.]